MTAVLHRCGGYSRVWSGLTECHCSECHEHFSNEAAFNAHRRDFQCADPAGLRCKDGNALLGVTVRRDGPVWHRARYTRHPFGRA